MIDDLSKWLQAIFHSGAISSYVSVQIPTGALKTGWIGQSLIQKGFSGKLEDKLNQEQLVIPLDRFVRLTNEWIDRIEPHLGLLLLGKRGLTESRFVALVSNDVRKKESKSLAIAFQSENFGLDDTIHQLVQSISGKKKSYTAEEPDLDYIEHLKNQTSIGLVTQLLALRLPSSENKIIEVIQDTQKDTIDSKFVITKYGNNREMLSIASLVSKWLPGLEIFCKDGNNVAAIVFVIESKIWLCLWDSPQGIVCFATINSDDIEDTLMQYVYPLWLSSDDLAGIPAKSPSVILGRKKTHSSIVISSDHGHKKSIPTTLQKQDTILENLIQRVTWIEDQLRGFENSGKSNSEDNSLSIVTSRLTDTIDRLESIFTKLKTLENRIDKVTKERN